MNLCQGRALAVLITGLTMNLKNIALLIFLGFGIGSIANAEEYAFGFSPRTGDAWMDMQLTEMNVYTRGSTDAFIFDVVSNFGAPHSLVSEYVLERRWAPGDIYFACALAYQLRVPCINILREYDKNNGKGWAVIARRMGIKPGSPEFQVLKGRVGSSNAKFKARGKFKAGQGEGMYRYGADTPSNSQQHKVKKN